MRAEIQASLITADMVRTADMPGTVYLSGDGFLRITPLTAGEILPLAAGVEILMLPRETQGYLPPSEVVRRRYFGKRRYCSCPELLGDRALHLRY